MSRIWVTRAAPGAQVTAARLRALGHVAIVAPVLEVRGLDTPLDLAGVRALAFTSANGVRAFAARSNDRDLRVFAVGAATAAAAKAERFRTILSTEGDVEALATAIATRKRELDGLVLHPGAAEPAGDLTGALARAGVLARALALYETVPAQLAPEVFEAIPTMDGVLVHSPSAGRRLADILAGVDAPGLTAYCLSPQVSATLAGLPAVAVKAATLPNEDALLSLIAP